MSTSSNSSSIHQGVAPSEVGWQFVPQYYTFVNKQPNRLHCFYTKSSTFIHGTEGEEVKPCYGQHEIHNKITSIGFQDCKVFIHSVDAQSSANGGIIIQVIGEMSNNNEPWRKFVQTFFLAEQPNGYFVLNDIFRFLKEEAVEEDDSAEPLESTEPAQPASAVQELPTQPAPPVDEPVYDASREPTPPPISPSPAPSAPTSTFAPTDEAPTTDVPEPATATTQPPPPVPEPQPTASPATQPQAQPNGIHPAEPEKPAPAPAPEKSPAPTTTPAPQPSAPAPAAPSPAPTQAPPPPPPTAAAPPPAPAPAPAPAAPRSWASLAASNPKKWGSAVAQESRGTTEVLQPSVPNSGTQTPPTQPAPASGRGPHQGGGGPGQGGRPEPPALVQAQNISTAQCFIKGVTEPISQTALTNFLTSRFGPIKELEIVRSKACAFLEFGALESAKRAIIASLSTGQGGEGGVWIDAEGGQHRLSIETKKERGDRPVSRPRGGSPMVNGEGRGGGGGSFRGRGGRGGRGTGPK